MSELYFVAQQLGTDARKKGKSKDKNPFRRGSVLCTTWNAAWEKENKKYHSIVKEHNDDDIYTRPRLWA